MSVRRWTARTCSSVTDTPPVWLLSFSEDGGATDCVLASVDGWAGLGWAAPSSTTSGTEGTGEARTSSRVLARSTGAVAGGECLSGRRRDGHAVRMEGSGANRLTSPIDRTRAVPIGDYGFLSDGEVSALVA